MEQIEGVKVRIGRREFIVPPLTMWAQERCEQLGAEAPALTSAQDLRDNVVDQVAALLEGNYPELSREDLKRLLPANQDRLRVVLAAVAKAASSGIEEAAPGEAGSP